MTILSRLARSLICFVLILFAFSATTFSQDFNFENEPLVEIFNQIQEETEYSFLYRESLISGLNLTFSTNKETLIADLTENLLSVDLTVRVDSVGQQLLVLPTQTPQTKTADILISGQVVDSKTGERLPFSTLSWREEGTFKGTVASQAGQFQFKIGTNQPFITLYASFVGYEKSSVTLDLNTTNQITDLTIRLQPQSVTGTEIIVIGNNYYSPQDSSLTGMIKTDRFSPLGDGNAVRALQVLPSVAPTTAMNEGLHIRGSTPDGFHLELDGITIFNQSHLFGLLDSFNEDAVINSGFFYNVAPAHINAPIGGKLSLTTRTGSLNEINAMGSVSNSSVRATVDGPFKKGKSSWLISGRTSYMNQVDWFNNNKLIHWGLDINRPKTSMSTNPNINTELVTPLDSDVNYFDLHGKFYHEQTDGSRNMASIYFGGDRTSHLANRLTRNNSLEERFRNVEVETENRWNNFAFSGQHQRSLSTSVYSNTTLAVSAYETYFSKDDFLYTNTTQIGESTQTTVFTYPLTNRSTMNRGQFDQTFDIFTNNFNLKAGFTGIYHRGEYQENSFERSRFYTHVSSFQGDLFLQTDFSPIEFLDLQTGVRSHYYSAGNYFKISPRLMADFFASERISFSLGYSKNYQFINRIGFSNAVTADVWILSGEEQPPSSVDQFTAGLYLKPFRGLYLQVEGYLKSYENLRSHELNAQSLTNTFNDSPWFFQNSGDGKGIEFLARTRNRFFTLTQTYTLSSIELQNEFLNEGEPFYAPWDRRHTSTTNLGIELLSGVQLFASYIVASGSVTGTFDFATGEVNRLAPYHRLDVSALFTRNFGENNLSAKVSVFNVLDEQNPWYREYQPVIVTRNTVPAIRSEIVTVYDLGIQPSFEIKIDF